MTKLEVIKLEELLKGSHKIFLLKLKKKTLKLHIYIHNFFLNCQIHQKHIYFVHFLLI